MTVRSPLKPGPLTCRITQICEGTPYQPLELLGRGGMGQVFVVFHKLLEKQFALKLLHPHLATHPRTIERFRIEAQAMARLRHPNIAKVTDFWVCADGTPSLVMELLNGHSLGDEILETASLPVDCVVTWGCQCLDALAAAHNIGLVHRDIKPDNLFLHRDREGTRIVKVLDFGLARVMSNHSEMAPSPLSQHTEEGVQVGSPRFMSPEGLRGKPVDVRADIYSLGLCLYLALVGDANYDRIRDKVKHPPSQSCSRPLPPGLDDVILRAIAVAPSERFQTALEFRSALGQFLPKPARPSSWEIRR